MILEIFSCYPSEERWGKHSDPPWVVSPWLVKAEVSKRKTASAQKAYFFLLDSTISTIQQRSTEYLNGGYNWQEFTQMMYCTLYILVPFRYTDDALFEIWAQVSKKPRTVSGFLEEDTGYVGPSHFTTPLATINWAPTKRQMSSHFKAKIETAKNITWTLWNQRSWALNQAFLDFPRCRSGLEWWPKHGKWMFFFDTQFIHMWMAMNVEWFLYVCTYIYIYMQMWSHVYIWFWFLMLEKTTILNPISIGMSSRCWGLIKGSLDDIKSPCPRGRFFSEARTFPN